MADKNYPEGITPREAPEPVQEIARAIGGTIEESGELPDGSGFAVMSFPLPKDHWSVVEAPEYETPPMRWRMGTGEHIATAIFPNPGWPARSQPLTRRQRLTRQEMAELIREAGKYAYRSATNGGKETDLDPDALLQNLVTAFLGYWSEDGRSEDEWANPEYERGKRAKE